MSDEVNHPPHYNSHPSGVECIDIAEEAGYCLGNAIKYVWRAGLKTPDAKKDYAKALFYVEREIASVDSSTTFHIPYSSHLFEQVIKHPKTSPVLRDLVRAALVTTWEDYVTCLSFAALRLERLV